jgi:uncharacterized protein (TIGR01244 family)
LKRLEDQVFVSGQIAPEDVAGLAAQGFAMLVNNRPDGEEPGQPEASEIEAAAIAAGLSYRFVPVAGLTPEALTQMREALQAADGKALAFCRSGTRSTYLWALARSGVMNASEIEARAARAGYDLTPIRRFL